MLSTCLIVVCKLPLPPSPVFFSDSSFPVGEIIPQAICARYGLRIGAAAAPCMSPSFGQQWAYES